MIPQNEVNVLGELENKADNCTVIIPYPTVKLKHIWQFYVTSELKIKLFCFFTIRAMIWIFIAVKKRYLNLSTVLKFAKTRNVPKTSRNEVMQPVTSNNNSRPIFPCHAHNQKDFDNSFNNGKGFIYLDISRKGFSFNYLQEFNVAYQ